MILLVVTAALLAGGPDGGIVTHSDALQRLNTDPDVPTGSDAEAAASSEDEGAGEARAGALTLEEEPASDGGTLLVVEESDDSPTSPGGTSSSLVARPFGETRLRAGIDFWPNPTPPNAWPEHVAEGFSSARVGIEARRGSDLRLLVEARARWFGAVQAEWNRPKGRFETELGEAYLDWYSPHVDLRVGQQVFTAGANAVLAPQDLLSPRDLRFGILGSPEESKLPAFGMRARGELPWFPMRWSASYVPFFVPHRYFVYAQDSALLQPGYGGYVPLHLDPTVEDRLQSQLLETRRPPDNALSGDVALSLESTFGPVSVGLSWTWMNEKLPQVAIDPELALVLEARQRGQEPSPAALLSVQNRLLAGERLFDGSYARMHQFAAQGSMLVGPVQLDADLAFSPKRTFVDDRFRPRSHPSITWVAGASPAEESDLVYNLTYLGMAVPGVRSDELLALLEPATARGADRTAWFHLLMAAAQYSLWDGALRFGGAVAVEPIQGSLFIAPEIRYRVHPRITVSLAAEIYGGPPRSPLGYFGRNDQLRAGLDLDLF